MSSFSVFEMERENLTMETLGLRLGSKALLRGVQEFVVAEQLAADRGILVPFNDPAAIARAISGLLSDEKRRQALCKNAYASCRKMVWSNVAQLYMRSFERARKEQCKSFTRNFRFPHCTSAKGLCQHDGLTTISAP